MTDTSVLYLLNELQYFMQDILLSGFHSIQQSSLEKLDEIMSAFDSFDMPMGKALTEILLVELRKRCNSFEVSSTNCMEAFCRLEFYTANAKGYFI